MKGLELSKKYYEEYGRAMIEEVFPEMAGRIAVGLVGEGSECLGLDDDISMDHDFEPGFCMWITNADAGEYEFKLHRAYSKLPMEFMGYKRSLLSPAGGNRRGVLIIEDFYRKHLGTSDITDDYSFWMYTEPAMLLTASNGEVWRDDLGYFSEIRQKIKNGYPKDVLLKKLAGHCMMAYMTGEYNFLRSCERGDFGAAALSRNEFVKHVISITYLLANSYEPYYKLAFRAMPEMGATDEILAIATAEVSGNTCQMISQKIECISDAIQSSMIFQGLLKITCERKRNLMDCSIILNDQISDVVFRNMDITG